MHYDSEKVKQFIHLLQRYAYLRRKKEDKRNVWAVLSRTPTYNEIQ